jgi:hypothetical protein
MLDCLESASFGSLKEQLSTWYVPWLNSNAAIAYKRLNNIFLTFTWLMLQGISMQGRTTLRAQVVTNLSQSGKQGSNSQVTLGNSRRARPQERATGL